MDHEKVHQKVGRKLRGASSASFVASTDLTDRSFPGAGCFRQPDRTISLGPLTAVARESHFGANTAQIVAVSARNSGRPRVYHELSPVGCRNSHPMKGLGTRTVSFGGSLASPPPGPGGLQEPG